MNQLKLPIFESLEPSRVAELTALFSERAHPVLHSSEIERGSARTKGIDYAEGQRYVYTILRDNQSQVNSGPNGALAYRFSNLLVQYTPNDGGYALIALKPVAAVKAEPHTWARQISSTIILRPRAHGAR